MKWFQQFSTRSNSMATLVYFSRKIDTWKQRFPFNRFAHRRRRKTPGDTNNTHEWKSTKFTCWQNHTETNNSLGSWLSFFRRKNNSRSRKSDVTRRWLTHHYLQKTKKFVMGEWRTAQPIGWSDQRRLRKFFGPIVFFLLSPAEPETKWWPG